MDLVRRVPVLLLSTALAVSSCAVAADGPSGQRGGSAPATGSGPTAADDDGAAGGVSQQEVTQRLRAATVKILSKGTFADPEHGRMANTPGLGSGFVIDPEGIVVTNNHVVTGAALVEVFVDGRERPVNARVLGVSECWDLAVIDLDGSDYPALEVSDAAPREGADVYAAGFPGSDVTSFEEADYTLTRGIVSSAEADGDTSWASVDAVLEHDARIRGGNSGGPLVGVDGAVVGVNYAGSDQSDQNYAISAQEAMPVIDRLRTGEDVEAIGVNGEARRTEEGASGVWVASVESGSPASAAGVQPGDVITTLQNVVLASDGTMADYCDILRTHGSDAVLAVEVVRPGTAEVLAGELNGRALAPVTSFAREVEDTGPASPVVEDSPDDYEEYVTVTDDTGVLSVEVPAQWSDVDGRSNPGFGPSIWAAPDLRRFADGWGVPGVMLEVSPELSTADVAATLDDMDFSSVCTSLGREPYEDSLYLGEYETWRDCGDRRAALVTVAAGPPGGSFLIRIQAQMVTDGDLEALDRVMDTFQARF